MRFIDALQHPVEIAQPPRRIVSLVPSLTEALFAFGLDEAIVGVTKFCVEPKAGVATKAKVGGTKWLDVPKVLELAPDLVIASAEENRKEDIEALIRASLSVFITLPTTVREGIDLMRTLAEMTGALDAAAPIIEGAEAALAETEAAVAQEGTVRVFCPIWRNPWMTVGPGTYTHDFLTVCGGANIFADRRQRYPRVDLGEMAQRDPEAILLPDEPYRFAAKHVAEFQAYPQIAAVRNSWIHLLEGKHLCWYGPRIAAGLRYVRGILHPNPLPSREREIGADHSPPDGR